MILNVGVSGVGKTTFCKEQCRGQSMVGATYSFDLWGQYPGRVCSSNIALANKGAPVSYRPHVAPYTEEARGEADKLVAWVDTHGGTLFLDEIQTYYDPMKPLAGGLLRLAHQPAKYPEGGVVVAAQRMQFIHAHLRAGVRVLVAFRQTGSRDVEMLYDSISTSLGRDVARNLAFEVIPRLPNFEYVMINLTGDPSREAVQFGVTRK